MQVNYEDFYKVTPQQAVEICERLARGDEVLSVRGEAVATAKAISYETATTGLRIPGGELTAERTIGGESPPPDAAQGFRPKEPGDIAADGNGAGDAR